jgi:DNA-directed RNA polymerase subunit RPC12/RpoP
METTDSIDSGYYCPKCNIEIDEEEVIWKNSSAVCPHCGGYIEY